MVMIVCFIWHIFYSSTDVSLDNVTTDKASITEYQENNYKRAIVICNPEDIVEIYDISYITGASSKVVNYMYYKGEEIWIKNSNYYYNYDINWVEVVDLNGFNLGYIDDRYISLID